MSLSCNCLGKQGFSGSRRAYEKRSLGKLRADLRVFSGIVQEIHHFLKGFLGFLLTGHILKGDACLLFNIYLGFAFADAHTHHAAATHFPHGKAENQPDKRQGKEKIKNCGKNHFPHIAYGRIILHTCLIQLLRQLIIRHNSRGIDNVSASFILLLGYDLNLI